MGPNQGSTLNLFDPLQDRPKGPIYRVAQMTSSQKQQGPLMRPLLLHCSLRMRSSIRRKLTVKVDGGIFIKLRFGSVVTYSSNNESINIFVHDP